MEKIDRFKIGLIILFDLLFVISGVAAFLSKNWLLMFISIAGVLLMFIPSFLEKRLKVDWPSELEIIILLFLIGSIYFGEILDYYHLYGWWDIALHTVSGIIVAMIAFSLIYVLNDAKAVSLTPFFIFLFAFCFSMCVGAIWEIFEFSVDQILGMNMQKSGLIDTMWDLIVDAIGAFLVSFVGYLYLKGKQFRIVKKYRNKFVSQNPHLFNQSK